MVAQFPVKKNLTVVQDLPPQNIDAEEAILGGLLLDPNAMDRIVNILETEAFYVTSHQKIYSVCLTLYHQGQPTDFLVVKSYLEDHGMLDKIGGMNKLMQLTNSVFSTVNIDHYAKLVVLKYQQRRAIAVSNEIQQIAAGYIPEGENPIKSLLEQVEGKLHELTRGKYRGDMNEDEATRMADKIANKIREIENFVVNPVHKEYKLMRLAQENKMTRKSLESLYVKTLLAQENEPTEIISNFIHKYGNDCNEWFLHGLLPKGSVILLHALGGVGKTRLAYDFCFSLATGTPWGNFPVTAESRKCLLVQTDETRGDLIRCLESRGFNDKLPIYIKSKWTVDHLASLRQDIIDNGIEVVVIDSLTTVSKSSIFSENDTEYAKPVLQLKDLAQELGITVLLIHHSNSEGKSRGTKAIHNSVSQVLSLRLPSEGSDVTCTQRLLVIEKSRFRRPTKYQLEYVIDEEDHSWAWQCHGEDLREPDPHDGIKQDVVTLLSKNRNQPLSNRELSDALGANYNTVRKATFQLATDGIITRQQLDSQGKPWVFYLTWEGEENTIEEKPFEKIPVDYQGDDQMIKTRFNQADEVNLISFNEDATATLLFEQDGLKYTEKVPCNDVREAQNSILTPPE